MPGDDREIRVNRIAPDNTVALPPIKIMAVDDDPQGLLAIEAALSGVDATLIPASSGEEALRLLLSEENYAVILLDVLMPGMDGFETAQLIRERERSRFTPIIFLTGASIENQHRDIGYAAGAVDYMIKPIEPWILRSKVDVFVDLARKAAMVNDLARKQAALLDDLAHNNAQLLEARARAERESRYKSTFLSTVSHELRTPMNAIIGFSEVLLRGYLGEMGPKQTQAIEAVHKSGQHLLAVINDILDISKIEAGKLALNRERFSLNSLLQSVMEVVRGMAAERGVRLECTLVDEMVLDADPVRLKQILFNLVSNGVKFTSRGGCVSLSASRDGRDLVVSVEDDGIGISEADQQLLFLPFQQLGTEGRRSGEGTGLGLALTKRLVQLHGGRITVRSVLSQGACFTFTMPVVTDRTLPPERPAALRRFDEFPDDLAPARILIVDDNDANRHLVRTILGVRGHEILEAGDVEEGISLVQATNPDLALLDIAMPGGGGTRLLQAIRDSQATHHMPVVAVTAYAMKGDRERFINAGFDEYIPKPVDPDELNRVVDRFLALRVSVQVPGIIQ